MDGSCRNFIICSMCQDMKMFVYPHNWDGSPGEHNLIDFAKQPAKNKQKILLSWISLPNDFIKCPVFRKLCYSFTPCVACNTNKDLKIDIDADNQDIESELVGLHFATIFDIMIAILSIISIHPLILYWFKKG